MQIQLSILLRKGALGELCNWVKVSSPEDTTLYIWRLLIGQVVQNTSTAAMQYVYSGSNQASIYCKPSTVVPLPKVTESSVFYSSVGGFVINMMKLEAIQLLHICISVMERAIQVQN